MLQEIIENKWENIDLDGVCEPVSILCCLNPDICDMIMMWSIKMEQCILNTIWIYFFFKWYYEIGAKKQCRK